MVVEGGARWPDGFPPPAWQVDYWRIADLIAAAIRTVRAAELRPQTPIAEQVAAEADAHHAVLRAVIELAKRANGAAL